MQYVQYVLAASYASTLDPTSALVVSAKSKSVVAKPRSLAPEALPQGPAGGALSFRRFGFTIAKNYVVFGPCFKGNLVVD